MSHFELEMHFDYFCLPRKVEAPQNMHFLVQDRNYEHLVLMPSFGKWLLLIHIVPCDLIRNIQAMCQRSTPQYSDSQVFHAF